MYRSIQGPDFFSLFINSVNAEQCRVGRHKKASSLVNNFNFWVSPIRTDNVARGIGGGGGEHREKIPNIIECLLFLGIVLGPLYVSSHSIIPQLLWIGVSLLHSCAEAPQMWELPRGHKINSSQNSGRTKKTTSSDLKVMVFSYTSS